MRIVLLDRSTLGDSDLSELNSCGEVVSYPITSPTQVVERCCDAEIVISNKVVLGESELDQLPDLRLIQVAATGVNNIDLRAARNRGVVVCNVPAYSTESVAQLTIGYILAFATSLHRWVQSGESAQWSLSSIFTRLDYPMWEVAGRVLGIVGSGTIGSRVGSIAQALGMEVIYLRREGASYSDKLTRVSKAELLECADLISLHAPLTEETRHFIDSRAIAQMKDGAILINTARGALVEEKALVDGLLSGKIAGAALDVLSVEPPPQDSLLLSLRIPQLIITPHIGWASSDARKRLVKTIVENIRSYKDGKLLNQVG